MSVAKSLLVALFLLTLTACISAPEGIAPVSSFEQERYLGTWYEVARTDNRFERGLSNVTATYSVKDNGALTPAFAGVSGEFVYMTSPPLIPAVVCLQTT